MELFIVVDKEKVGVVCVLSLPSPGDGLRILQASLLPEGLLKDAVAKVKQIC